MTILLVGNYPPDGQESMLRFVEILRDRLPRVGFEVRVLQPESRLGRFSFLGGRAAKYLAYWDKYVLFPRNLRRFMANPSCAGPCIVHICDHSNAVYFSACRHLPRLLTCHDLIAVRSALGEYPRHQTGWSGRHLQNWILHGIRRAHHIACDSQATREDVLAVAGVESSRATVHYIGLNYPYRPMLGGEAQRRFNRLFAASGGIPAAGYLLHVGGDPWYKNRTGLVHIYAALKKLMPDAPALVFAGRPLSQESLQAVADSGLEGNVISMNHCSNEDLRALYSHAALFVFPSHEEGFGWPIIEAQACGCRVAVTHKAPMTEVGGASVFKLQPHHVEASAQVLRRALGETACEREARIRAGFENVSRFSTERMIQDYALLYRDCWERFGSKEARVCVA